MGCLTYSGSICIQLCNLGQEDCSSGVICEYGYFLFEEECVYCPYQTVDDRLTLYCMDCVEHPYTWYQNRTCSYDYTIENGDSDSGTYIKSVREYTELYYIGPALANGVSTDTITREVFIFQKKIIYKYQPYICSGCKSFCTPGQDSGCNAISSPYTEDQNIQGIICLSTFEFQNEMCISCPSNCLTCSNGVCTNCMSGYMVQNNECTACISNCLSCYPLTATLQQLCLQCDTGYVASLDQLKCEACGDECNRCEYTSYQTVDYQYPTRYQVRILTPSIVNLYVKRCRQCSTKSFISSNGEDCASCQIRFCDICYYNIRGGVTTLDIDFEPAKSGDNVSDILCFKCQSGYVLSQDGLSCNTLPALAHIVQNCDRNYYKDSDLKCLQCLSNYILDQSINGCYGKCSSYISHCSICYSYKSLDITNYLENGQVKTRTAQTLFQCITCDSGYYPNLFTGYCDPCPGNCAQCWQYSQTYNFTDFLTKMEPLDTSQKEIFLNDIPIQVECTTCQDGYQLYDNECLGCTSDCQVENSNQDSSVMGDDLISSCVFKSKFAFCGQCYDPYNDRSVIADKSECISCPNNCVACRDRLSSEITNLYFNPDNSNLLSYGRLCYKVLADQMSNLMQVTYNSILNLPILCVYDTASISNTNRCKHKASITVNIYCDEDEYNAKIATLDSSDLIFYYYLNDSYYLDSQVNATISFSNIQNFDVYSKMNSFPLEILEFNVKFVSTATSTCSFLKTTIFENKFQRNVYAITDFSMHIYSDEPITFYVKGLLEFENFQNIKISNINIYPADTSYFGINFYGSLPSIVTLQDCQMKSATGVQFQLLFTNILQLTLEEVTISYLSSSDSITIDQSAINNYTITLNNLIIEHSTFVDTVLFPLSPFGDFLIDGFSIIDCSLNNTHLFEDNGDYQEYVASLTINNMIIEQSYFYKGSSIVQSMNFQYLILTKIDLVGCNFNQSELFISNIYTMSQVYIYGNVFTNESRVFVSADQVADNSLFNTQITTSQIIVENLKFTSNTCYNINCLMILETPFTPSELRTSVLISDLYIYNNYIEIDLSKTKSVSSALVRITKINRAVLNNIVIDTQLAITVISLQDISSVDINTFLCDWSKNQFGPKDPDPKTKLVNNTQILYPFNNKIPGSSQCSSEKYKFGSYNQFCLHVQDFLYGVRIVDAALKGLLGIDTGFIYIQSYESLIKQTSDYTDETATKDLFYYDFSNEVIILQNIRIFNTSISAASPVSSLAAIVINSDQEQTILINGVTAIGNHLHQQVESITTVIAPCLVILSTNGNVSISNMEYHFNRATQSYYGINVFKSYVLEISNSLFNYTNILESNWLNRFDEYQISSYSELISFFTIESNGANFYIQCKFLIMNAIQMLNTKSMSGGSLYFSGLDTADIQIQNSQFINQSASLEYIDASFGGSFYFDCSKSKLTLSMSYITMNNSMARLKGGCIYIDASIQQQTIIIDYSSFYGCKSLSSSVLDVSFSVSSKILPAVMINNTQITNNYFGSFLRNIPDISYEEEMLIVGGTSLVVQNYGILTMQSCQFTDIDIQGLLLLTNMVEVIFEDITIRTSKIFISSLIDITNFNQYSVTSLNNIIISDVSEQSILTPAQFVGVFNSVCDQSSTLFESINTQVCTDQEDLRSFYQELFNYRQISQQKLDNYSLYDYYDSLTDDDKYTLDSINLDTSRSNNYQENSIEMINNTISMNNYELCYFTYISQTYTITNDTALIKISPIKNVNFVNLSSITVKNNNCQRCEGGLVQLNNFDYVAQNSQITQMICQSNKIGYFGCLAITTQSKSSYTVNRRLLTQGYNVNISKSIFSMNYAKMGTAISIIGLSANLEYSQFSDNTATLIGGALLFVYSSESKNILNQYENSYIQNKAQLGSAIYMMGNTINDEAEALLYLYHNEGTQVESIPQKLTITMITDQLMETMTFGTSDGDLDDDGIIDGQNSQIIDVLNIGGTTVPTATSDYLLLPSGQAISNYKYYYAETQEQVPYDWIFRIVNLDESGKVVNSISSSETCNIAGRLMDSENLNLQKTFLTNFTSLSVVSFDTSTNTFNLDNMQVYFDPYLPSNLYLQLKFTCTSIKVPIYNQNSPYDVTGYDTNYALYVNIRTIPCQVGEAYYDQMCVSCDSANTYSVQENSVQCKGINSIQMADVLPVRIKLNSYYWRPYPLNDNIEQCYNLVSNCLGGWVAGDASCYEGHIGALCEQCDIYGIRGSQYSISKKYTCGACEDTLSTNILIIIAISIFTLITMVMSVKGNYEFIENLVHQQVLQSIGARNKISQNNASILMKQLTNYLQIIAALNTFRISLPTSFVNSMEVMGNPTQSMAYSLDCFLVSIASMDLLYFRMAWALLMPIFYVSLFFIGYFFGVFVRLAPFKIGVIYTTFIYMFIYLQPTLVGGFMALLSSRAISGIDWVQGNVSYEYQTTTHQYYLIIFIGPMLLLWSVIFPLIFLQCVKNNKDQLNKMSVLKKWGFFYHEYNEKSYLWEFVKIFEKELVIISLTYYENQIVIKGLIVFLIIFIYGAFSFAFIPYKQKKLNFVDQMSTAVCACSLCLGVLIYASQTENLDYLQYTMFFIIGMVNAVLILLILSHLFQGYVDKFDDKLDTVRDKIKMAYPNIDFQFPCLRKYLINKKYMKERVDHLWAVLRYETRGGIKRRRQDKNIPLFISKRRKSTSISQEPSEKDFRKNDSPSIEQQEHVIAQSPETNSDGKTVLIKKPVQSNAIQQLIVKQGTDEKEKHSSESSDSKIYPEIHSGFPSSRQVDKIEENKKLLRHKL